MSKGIVSFNKETVIDFMPEYGGNREGSDPCVVSLKFIPYSKVQYYAKILKSKTANMVDASDIQDTGFEVQAQQFYDSVQSVKNFFVDGKEVKTAKELYASADSELVIEIIKAMESSQKLSEGQVKNS